MGPRQTEDPRADDYLLDKADTSKGSPAQPVGLISGGIRMP